MANILHVAYDSLTNLVSRLGTGRDKAASSFYATTVLTDQEIFDAYRRACPLCRRASRRIHSWYSRTVSDLPCAAEGSNFG